jgi:hypothetical protein
MIAAADTYATTEELLEAVFSMLSMPRLYNEDQLPLQKSSEMAVRREEVGVRWSPALESVSRERVCRQSVSQSVS